MNTFYKNLRSHDNTLILIKDEADRVFGAYCSDEWRISYSEKFYGKEETFVFNLDNEDDI